MQNSIPQKVLVTGASGFIGRQVVSLLVNRGYEVHVTSRAPSFLIEGAVTHSVNLLDTAQIQGLLQQIKLEGLIHLSWEVSAGTFRTSENNLLWLSKSLDLLKAFAENGGSRMVFAGSCSEYTPGQGMLSEESDISRPACLYGSSKAAFYIMANRLTAQLGLSYRHARIFTVYGPGEVKLSSAIPLCIQSLLSGKEFVCKAPDNVWDYLYIEDAARALVALYETPEQGVFNIASGRPVVMREVFNTIGRLTGREELVRFDPHPSKPGFMTANTQKLNQILKFIPQTKMEEGLQKTVDWWKTRV